MPDTPKLILRPMVEADLAPTLYIRKAALEWLDRSQGREPQPWVAQFPATMAHVLSTDPDGCIVATIDGVPVGYAQALVRGDIWFLAQLFVQPEVHAHGIGAALLDRAHAYGRGAGARIFSVVSTASPISQSLYMRHGMFAIGIGYRLEGDLNRLRELPAPSAGDERVIGLVDHQEAIAVIDREAFGAERRQDHAWYLGGDSTGGAQESFGLRRSGELVAYGYAVAQGGFIAPIAAREPEIQLPILRMGAEWLLDHDVATATIWAVSTNQTIVGALLGAGWRINGWSFLLSSERFGTFDRYHPAGGILL